MRKRIAVLALLLVMVVLLAGCSSQSTVTIHSKSTPVEKPIVGSVSFFKTSDVQEYLNFLENMDDTKMRILDISIGTMAHNDDSLFYTITYKTISE